MQQAFLNGLASDVTPSVNSITVQSVTPLLQSMQCDASSGSLPACPLVGSFAQSYVDLPNITTVSPGIIIEFSISGYATLAAAQADMTALNLDSGTGFSSTAAKLSAYESTLLQSYAAAAAAGGYNLTMMPTQSFDSQPIATIFLGLLDENSAPAYAPTIYAVYSANITTTAQDLPMHLNYIDNALSTNTLSGNVSSWPPSRALGVSEAISCPSSSTKKLSAAWYGVGIAFLIAFGVQSAVLAAVLLGRSKAAASVAAKSASAVDGSKIASWH
jgi:hypothetical protein